MTDALPSTNAAEEKTRFSVGGGRGGCAEYRTKDVAMTSPMAAKTTTRNHRWETEDGSDTGSYAAHPRLKPSRGFGKRPFCGRRGSRPRPPRIGSANRALVKNRTTQARSGG